VADVDAIVLAGGKGSRLGGADKAALIGVDGKTSLQRTILACREVDARRVVVVGPPDRPVTAGVEVAQEDPPGSGPALAIAAGLARLASDASDDVLVLACDMPNAAPGVEALLAAPSGPDGVVGVAGGHRQWLLGLYKWAALVRACAKLDGWNAPSDPSVGYLLGDLDLREVAVPPGAADDIDTEDDLNRLHYRKGDNNE